MNWLLAGDIVFAVCLLTFHVWFALRQGGQSCTDS